MGRRVSPETLAARRIRDDQVLRSWLDGESQAAIGRAMGLSHKGVQMILNRIEDEWRAQRAQALRAAAQPPCSKRTGRKAGPGRPRIWPDCPPELRRDYHKIGKVIGRAAAKAQLLALVAKEQGSMTQ